MDKMKDQERIARALKAMVSLRAGKIDPTTLSQYSTRLTREFLPDVMMALEKLSELPRGEFETALPDIATILKLVSVEAIGRQNRSEIKKSERLVRWVCPDCGRSMIGFPPAGNDLTRRCEGIPKDKRMDRNSQGVRICGAAMEVVLDEGNERLDKWNDNWSERSGAR